MRSVVLTPCLVVVLFVNGLFGASNIYGDPVDVVHGNNTIGIRDLNNQNVCLLLSFTKLDVDVRGGPHNQTYLNQTYSLSDIDWYPDTSSCLLATSNLTKQRLSLNVTNNHLDFYFQLDKVKKTYNMSHVTFKAENAEQFANTSLLGVQAKMMPDLKIKPLSKSLDQSFECKHRYLLRFNFTEPNGTANNIEINIKIQGLRFSAFRKSNSTEFTAKNKIYCPAPKTNNKPGNDIVPIAVGSVLTGCLVISLVGYLIIRARKT